MFSSLGNILVLGSTGFLGKNISEIFSNDFSLIRSVKDRSSLKNGEIWFDLLCENSWEEVTKISPSIIINCIGYGVVKTERDLEKIYDVNYFKTIAFYEFISFQIPNAKIVHIGTAFEYDLSIKILSENSGLLPQTHYGISKLMASNFLLQKKIKNQFIILRPFNMFGLYEDESKIIPYLILSQKNKSTINLSSGLQRRDYLYVEDFVRFVFNLIKNKTFVDIPHCINVGEGISKSIQEIAFKLSSVLPTYDARYWNWNTIPQRIGEQDNFFNNSDLCKSLGFKATDLEKNLISTVNYYWNL